MEFIACGFSLEFLECNSLRILNTTFSSPPLLLSLNILYNLYWHIQLRGVFLICTFDSSTLSFIVTVNWMSINPPLRSFAWDT